jgi:endonuclease YncB( thermonuclease family)
MRGGQIGSVVLLIVVALVVLRPWEGSGGEAGPAAATVRVLRVVDGDTIEIELDGGREDLRLIGIDTPETVKPGTPVQCYGPRASAFTHGLLEGRTVRVVFGVERRDVYGRLLGYVSLGDRMVNAILVRRGLARTLTIPPNDRFAPLFDRLELEAARAGRGLWDACRP